MHKVFWLETLKRKGSLGYMGIGDGVILKMYLEFEHPHCVCNNEVKHNEGQNTTKFIS